MLNGLAPIGLSTYIRLQHLRKSITALQNNIMAQKSELFIFSDAPRDGDEERVAAVRSYLRTVDGFRQVHITERAENLRMANNRSALRMLLDRYGKVIFIEEDVITAPGFLVFMNQALDKYESNDQIFSVAGYCPPIKIPANYQDDVFLLRRFNSWGRGIWKNRYDCIKYITPDEFEQFSANKKLVREFVKGGGDDMMVMLKAEAYGEIDAIDVKAMYAQYLSDQYTVYPTRSLVQNIGLDGTGTHCGNTLRFDVVLSNKTTFRFPDDIAVDKRIVMANRKFRAGPGNGSNLICMIRGFVEGWLVKCGRNFKSSVSRIKLK